MNESQSTSRQRAEQSIPLRESVEKTGWKEDAGGPRPAPPPGQGRTPTSSSSDTSSSQSEASSSDR